jgi:hypothetical protein
MISGMWVPFAVGPRKAAERLDLVGRSQDPDFQPAAPPSAARTLCAAAVL